LLNAISRSCLSACVLSLMLSGCTFDGLHPMTSKKADANDTWQAQSTDVAQPARPSLMVTSAQAPEVFYRPDARDTTLMSGNSDAMSEILQIRAQDEQGLQTPVTRKAVELQRDLDFIKQRVAGYRDRLSGLQRSSDAAAARYYEIVAAIQTELQAGSTPGNPILTQRWNVAQQRLQDLSNVSSGLNSLSSELSTEASKAVFLQENVRDAYSISGAVKSDHDRLRTIEDGISQNLVLLNRLLTSTSEEINRRQAYLRTEKLNLQTLSAAISTGELYGQNLSNSLYNRVTNEGKGVSQDGAPPAQVTSQKRPLVIIRFDRPNVRYEQALYTAVSQALEKYPSARFDVVAVSPASGSAAEMALASGEARKNGEAVLRSLANMGLPSERVRVSAANADDVRNSEVRIFIQ
jgi:hypothetical protein